MILFLVLLLPFCLCILVLTQCFLGYNYTMKIQTSYYLLFDSAYLTDIETYTEEIWIKVLSTAGSVPTETKLFIQPGIREVRINSVLNTIFVNAKNSATGSVVEGSKLLPGFTLKTVWYHVLVQFSKPLTTMRLFWNHRLASSINVDFDVFFRVQKINRELVLII